MISISLEQKKPPRLVRLEKRKLVQGVGINDANYETRKRELINGKFREVWRCPFYGAWMGMINRCYCQKKLYTRPSYEDCLVCDEWLTFSNFKAWMEKQNWKFKHLDKDILITGNKIYSPETCVFVDAKINSFINERPIKRGEFLLGASWHKASGKFVSQCRNPFMHTVEHLGLYDNELDAHLAWKSRKHELACKLADSEYCTDLRVKKVLKTKYIHKEVLDAKQSVSITRYGCVDAYIVPAEFLKGGLDESSHQNPKI